MEPRVAITTAFLFCAGAPAQAAELGASGFKVSTTSIVTYGVSMMSRKGTSQQTQSIQIHLMLQSPLFDKFSDTRDLAISDALTDTGEPLGRATLSDGRRNPSSLPGEILASMQFHRNGPRWTGRKIRVLKGNVRIALRSARWIPIARLEVDQAGKLHDEVLRKHEIHLEVLENGPKGAVIFKSPSDRYSRDGDRFSSSRDIFQACKDWGDNYSYWALRHSQGFDRGTQTFAKVPERASGCSFVFILPSTTSVNVPFEFHDIELP